jgi:hypothetical protein
MRAAALLLVLACAARADVFVEHSRRSNPESKDDDYVMQRTWFSEGIPGYRVEHYDMDKHGAPPLLIRLFVGEDYFEIVPKRKDARRIADPDKTIPSCAPVLARPPELLKDLCFGKEREFFDERGAERKKDSQFNGQAVETYVLDYEGWVLRLYADPGGLRPRELRIRHAETATDIRVIYAKFSQRTLSEKFFRAPADAVEPPRQRKVTFDPGR